MSNNIDDFFKEGLNQPDFEYNEETWKGFQELYEKEKEEDPVVIPFINKSLLIGGLVLLAFLGIIYFGFNKYSNEDNGIDNSGNNIIYNNIIANSSEKENTPTHTTSAIKTNDKVNSISETTDKQSKITDNNRLNKQSTSTATTTNPIKKTVEATTPFYTNNSYTNIRNNSTSINSNLTAAIPAPIEQPVVKPAPITLPTSKFDHKKEEEAIAIAETQNFNALNSLPILATGLLDDELSTELGKDLRIKYKRKMKGQFFVMASLGLGNIDSRNFDLGFGKKFAINKYLGINIGAKYKYISAPKLEKHRGFNAKYSRADQVFFAHHIEADNMHIAAIPASFEFAYARHRLNLGATYNRLFLVKGVITRHEADIEDIRTAWIVETGINLNLLSTNVAYGFMINPSTEIFANAELFLTDTYNNESTISHKFNNYNLGIKYTPNSLQNNPTLRFL